MLITIVFYFLLWELILYWMHRISHKWHPFKKYHWAHHKAVNNLEIKWFWQMIFLYQEDWDSTVDLILTELLPTLVFCLITGQWWIMIFWYLWTAFIQEHIQHNPRISSLPLMAGKPHLVHHGDARYNYSVFSPTWDIIFRTYKPYKK